MQLGRERLRVVAVIAILGDRLAGSNGQDRRTQLPDLGTRIVEVILPGNAVAARLEDPAEHVAHEGAAGIADRQWAGGIGRHELDIDSARPARRHPAPAGRLGQDPGNDAVQCRIRKVQVDEALWRYADRGDWRRGWGFLDLTTEL